MILRAEVVVMIALVASILSPAIGLAQSGPVVSVMDSSSIYRFTQSGALHGLQTDSEWGRVERSLAIPRPAFTPGPRLVELRHRRERPGWLYPVIGGTIGAAVGFGLGWRACLDADAIMCVPAVHVGLAAAAGAVAGMIVDAKSN